MISHAHKTPRETQSKNHRSMTVPRQKQGLMTEDTDTRLGLEAENTNTVLGQWQKTLT